MAKTSGHEPAFNAGLSKKDILNLFPVAVADAGEKLAGLILTQHNARDIATEWTLVGEYAASVGSGLDIVRFANHGVFPFFPFDNTIITNANGKVNQEMSISWRDL